ncbi:diguanylate cyclase [bacterium]|nr:diguanylate cyclase [bacterium]
MTCQQLEFYSSIVVLTGPGLSARSGLPAPATLSDGNWETVHPLQMLALQAQPNDCHGALADWERRVLERRGQFTILTHNTDGLHQRAGSQNVVELYGSMHRLRCTNPQCEWRENRFWELPLPACPDCSCPTRPDVAWYGEEPAAEMDWLAQRALRRCDLFLALAVSDSTPRLHDFVNLARFAKARTVLVSVDHSAHMAEEFDEIHDCPAEDFVTEIRNCAQAVKEPTRLRPLTTEEAIAVSDTPADLAPLQKSFTSGYLAVFDVADFKTRNHMLGHAQGDQDLEDFLQVAAAVGVQACMRYSQDQFVVLCPRLETLEALQRTYSNEQKIQAGYRALACRDGCLRSKVATHDLRLRRAVRVAYVMIFRGQALDDAARQVAEKVKFVRVDQILAVNEIQSEYHPWSALHGEFSALQCPFCHGGEFDWNSQDLAAFGREGQCRQCGSEVEFENFSQS